MTSPLEATFHPKKTNFSDRYFIRRRNVPQYLRQGINQLNHASLHYPKIDVL